MLLIILAFKIILIKSYAVVKSYVDANFMMNNGGGPFESIGDCGHPNNTKLLECNVLDYYASLWHAKWPHNESYWVIYLIWVQQKGIFILFGVHKAISVVVISHFDLIIGNDLTGL